MACFLFGGAWIHTSEVCKNEKTQGGPIMLRAALKFARIRITTTCMALALLGSIAAGGLAPMIIIALLLAVLINVHANSINDYTDRDIDRHNLKGAQDRPLVTGDISLREFWILHVASAVLIMALSSFYGWKGILCSAVMLLVSYAYSIRPVRLTARPLISPVVLALAYVYYSFTFGFWSMPDDRAYPFMLTVGLFVGFIARILLKDFRDIRGDKKYGKITFLIRYGANATIIASALLFIAASIIICWVESFAYGITIALTFCTAASCWLFVELSKSTQSQQIIIHTARLANIAIIVLMVHLICRNQVDLPVATGQMITLVVGLVLTLRVMVDYLTLRGSDNR
jgi:4-hydroxybenzoate polyprenyltransferase